MPVCELVRAWVSVRIGIVLRVVRTSVVSIREPRRLAKRRAACSLKKHGVSGCYGLRLRWELDVLRRRLRVGCQLHANFSAIRELLRIEGELREPSAFRSHELLDHRVNHGRHGWIGLRAEDVVFYEVKVVVIVAGSELAFTRRGRIEKITDSARNGASDEATDPSADRSGFRPKIRGSPRSSGPFAYLLALVARGIAHGATRPTWTHDSTESGEGVERHSLTVGA
jgi:hypothetical protein